MKSALRNAPAISRVLRYAPFPQKVLGVGWVEEPKPNNINARQKSYQIR
ncbi:MAG: hypothetical protein F6K18_32840 [Okeania sp. SIO2C2]|nr:hypothetical protein [Okeania sp. SIO2C2]NEP91206.1 hypothetical protein [Okeania sp. SIO2C2]